MPAKPTVTTGQAPQTATSAGRELEPLLRQLIDLWAVGVDQPALQKDFTRIKKALAEPLANARERANVQGRIHHEIEGVKRRWVAHYKALEKARDARKKAYAQDHKDKANADVDHCERVLEGLMADAYGDAFPKEPGPKNRLRGRWVPKAKKSDEVSKVGAPAHYFDNELQPELLGKSDRYIRSARKPDKGLTAPAKRPVELDEAKERVRFLHEVHRRKATLVGLGVPPLTEEQVTRQAKEVLLWEASRADYNAHLAYGPDEDRPLSAEEAVRWLLAPPGMPDPAKQHR